MHGRSEIDLSWGDNIFLIGVNFYALIVVVVSLTLLVEV